jgi:hypothetical protein
MPAAHATGREVMAKLALGRETLPVAERANTQVWPGSLGVGPLRIA